VCTASCERTFPQCSTRQASYLRTYEAPPSPENDRGHERRNDVPCCMVSTIVTPLHETDNCYQNKWGNERYFQRKHLSPTLCTQEPDIHAK
jgi:hypothetical protein